MLADVSSMTMSSELRRHYAHISFFKAVFTTCSHSFPYSLVLNVHALTPCILTPSDFLTEHAIKHNHKPTATPTLTVLVALVLDMYRTHPGLVPTVQFLGQCPVFIGTQDRLQNVSHGSVTCPSCPATRLWVAEQK